MYIKFTRIRKSFRTQVFAGFASKPSHQQAVNERFCSNEIVFKLD